MKFLSAFCFIVLSFFLIAFLSSSYQKTDPHFIFIAGGSASGKTTLARTLVSMLGEDQALYLSLDEYLDKRVQPQSDFIEGIPNFDNPSMTNWKLLMENINSLREGFSIDTPIYDFSSWIPVGFRRVPWKPIVVIEGIHATQNELDSIPGLRIFIDVHKDLRYQRRLERDVRERNYPVDLIEKIFCNFTLPYESIFLEPTRSKADMIIENLDGEDSLKETAACILENSNLLIKR